MKKLNCLYIIVVLAVMLSFNSKSLAVPSMPQKDANINVAVSAEDDDFEETDIIKRVSLRDKFKRSPEAQINSFFKKYNRYSSKNNIEKLKELYSDDYINNDGFNKETIFKMMEMASGAYKDVSYVTEIESIKVEGNYAVVKAHELATGETIKVIEKLKDTGSITSEIYYTDYLRKDGNKWKIIATDINSEKVELKYGEAKNMIVDICAPQKVPEGSEYEVTMKTKTPDGVFAVGSIVNEPIVYPQVQAKDVFRSIKSETLSRILKANKDKNNEYATVSIAITRAQVQPPSLVLNMTGMAFVMKRVNVLSLNKNVKLDKEKNDVKTTKN
ncbi:TPA: nuclear transport factor 2 family protein [Candidatus Avigastranaerophilus faecigallinarum]|nr:nuclear transport factor 2 family protein [Candidatus Avigastranaerophilus faecigallinarum]